MKKLIKVYGREMKFSRRTAINFLDLIFIIKTHENNWLLNRSRNFNMCNYKKLMNSRHVTRITYTYLQAYMHSEFLLRSERDRLER